MTLWAAPQKFHLVQKGDTLDAIARNYGTSIKALQRTNNLRSSFIKVGQKLKVPADPTTSDITHTVRKGETLGIIARNYGTSVSQLKRANSLKSDLIKVGQQLTIPGRQTADAGLIAPVIAATKNIRVDSSRWKYVVCHHSAIEAGNAEIYGNAHLRRGMENGLAYHFVIGNGRDSGDGEIEIGPRWTKQLRGGHVQKTSVNDSGIGICIVGNLQNHAPTLRQHQSLVELISFLRDGHVRSNVELTVHKWVDKNHTLCPGQHFPYDDLKRFA
ncbi:MAG: LysM peptidoglycan-binding domain-containing protein [Candidatus Synoicihabitans palmerolidicus]|nr:LysM peptidoglycan-binding domain-containing protein [Candidatus Synoicihabitans palmerolidicus]